MCWLTADWLSWQPIKKSACSTSLNKFGASFAPDKAGGHTYGPGNVGDNSGLTCSLWLTVLAPRFRAPWE